MRYFIIWIFLLPVTALIGQPLTISSPESVGMSSKRLNRLNQQMHQFVDKGEVSSVQTAIYRKGKLVHFDTYFLRIDPKEELIYIFMIQLRPYHHLKAREKFQTMVYQAIVD